MIKADGLAAGKGVVVAADSRQAELTLEKMLAGELVGEAGRRLILHGQQDQRDDPLALPNRQGSA